MWGREGGGGEGRGARGAGRPHLAPVPLRGGCGGRHLRLLLALLQLLTRQHHLTGVIPTLGAVPVTAGTSPPVPACLPHPAPSHPARSGEGRAFQSKFRNIKQEPGCPPIPNWTCSVATCALTGGAERERSAGRPDARPSPPGISRRCPTMKVNLLRGYRTPPGKLDGQRGARPLTTRPPWGCC